MPLQVSTGLLIIAIFLMQIWKFSAKARVEAKVKPFAKEKEICTTVSHPLNHLNQQK